MSGRIKDNLSIIQNRKIGFVFQTYNLLVRTFAFENVELLLLNNLSVSASERRIGAINALEQVGLKEP
jgi:putative ABC transport system ATP-binding protein